MKDFSILFLAFLVLSFAGCRLEDDDQIPPDFDTRPIVEIIKSRAEFSILTEVLTRTGLDISLSGGTFFTVFAPTDAAFAASGLDLITTDSIVLENILRYHILGGVGLTRQSIAEGQLYVNTINRDSPGNNNVQLFIERTNDDFVLNGLANLTGDQLIGSNGVIHTIDMVLLPPRVGDMIRQNSLLAEFAALMDAAAPLPGGSSVIDSLNSNNLFTVFAPLNSNFTPEPPLTPLQLREAMLYHIVGGRSTRFNNFPGTLTTIQGDQLLFTGRNIRTTSVQSITLNFEDIQATNGLLHLVSEVMLPEGL